ncbi:hypothetical protein [Sediminivirga luteola]|uniref:hypothetical protein n=1 Tax=Sediminivirga luteola TaxID=1774748 RepID=UPI0016693329|nr:hypothetical protein [Sediminivirga luteola]
MYGKDRDSCLADARRGLIGFALHVVDDEEEHVVDDEEEEVYTYVRELGTWNLDRDAASDFYFPELDDRGVVFTEVTLGGARDLRERAPVMDLDDDAMRRLSDRWRAQLGVPGQTRTSAEVGL